MRTKLAAGIMAISAVTIIGGSGSAAANASASSQRPGHLRIMSTKATSRRHVSKSVTASFNSSTCLLSETERGTFTIGRGTGKFAGIHGSGKFVTSIVAVTAKNRAGRCTHVQAPATFQGMTTATGTVSG